MNSEYLPTTGNISSYSVLKIRNAHSPFEFDSLTTKYVSYEVQQFKLNKFGENISCNFAKRLQDFMVN